MLVHADDSGGFNPESEIALVKGTNTYALKFKQGCKYIYDKVQRYKVILQKTGNNQVNEFIQSNKGHITSIDEDFDKVMREENLTDIMGNVRLIRINYEIKSVTNGKDCEPCIC